MWRLLFVLLFIPTVAQGAIYYVSKSGSDSNGCTNSTTDGCLTVVYGLSKLSSGDTLYIGAGTYAEAIRPDLGDNLPSGGGSWAMATTIAAMPGETVILQPSDINAVIYLPDSKSYIIFDGLILDATSGTAFGVNSAATYIKFSNGEIKNAPMSGALALYHSWFTNMNIHNNGSHTEGGVPQDHGLYITGDNNLIENSSIHDNWGYGIQNYQGDYLSAHDNTYRNNRIYNNGTGAAAAGIVLESGINLLAYDNQISGNTGEGIRVDAGSSGAEIHNNTIIGNTGGTNGGNCVMVNIATSVLVNNNICYQNDNDGIATFNGGGYSGANNVLGMLPALSKRRTF